MKKIVFIALVFGALMMSSCVEETFPEGGTATSGQVGESPSALDASVKGIPSQMVQGYLVYGDQVSETDMGYPSLMITFTELMGDIFVQPETNPGFDWFRRFNYQSDGLGPETFFSYIPWRTLYMFVKSANDVIKAIRSVGDERSDLQNGMLGMALCYRAFTYWNLWNMYVPVENEYTNISADIKNLTVPIVTEETTEEQGKNNPRVPVEEMFTFIMNDLDEAEAYLGKFTPESKLMPNLAVCYGLKARAYLSHLEYDKAAEFARKAIDASGCSPLTQSQWEDPNSGFCDASSQNSWMWFLKYSPETMGNLCNYIGWVSGEADWGYNALCNFCINRWLYDRLGEKDFRKYSFIDPEGYDFHNYLTSRSKEWIESMPPYLSIKFRCKTGDWGNYAVGGAADVPMMRVEEMYLIEAEALGVANLEKGKAALEKFIKENRDPDYSIPKTVKDLASFQEEVIFHKRVEFWGEGTAFFDCKRLQLGSLQYYEGTNAPGEMFYINAKGIKPGWNFVIPRSEVENNVALDGYNNPDPSGTIKPVKPPKK